MILSTCNRVEITLTTDDAVGPAALVDEFPAGVRRASACVDCSRTSTATKAARPSITCSAWRPAWIPWWWASRRFWASSRPPTARARIDGALCGWLDGLLARAFSVAKRVRSETGIGQMAVSVSYAAVELARKIFGSLEQPHRDDRGRGQDVGAGGAASAPLGRVRTFSSPTARTSAPWKWPSCSRARRSNIRASSACCRRWIS